MQEADAEEFTQALAQVWSGGWRMALIAEQLGVPKALGYASVREYIAERLGGPIRLSIEERREAVKELTAPKEEGGEGLSNRKAAEVLGVDEITVRRDGGGTATNVAPQDKGQIGKGGGTATNVAPPPEPETPALPEDASAQKNPALYTSETEEWYTPPQIIKATVAVLGTIDLDPCSNPGKPNIPAIQHFRKEDDGLSRPWHGRVYMNPPYGNAVEAWVRKLLSEYETGNVSAAIALVPARTDTQWFRLLRDHPVCFKSGRLKFSGQNSPAPFPSAAFYLGDDRVGFYRQFVPLGDIYERVEA